MKDVRAAIFGAIAIFLGGCSEPAAFDSEQVTSVPDLILCASIAEQNARRGNNNFEPNGSNGFEARAIFYRAKLHASNGVSDRQLALWANQGEDPLPISRLDQIGQQAILRQCEVVFERAQAALPVSEQGAAERCYVAAKFIQSQDLADLIARRYDVNDGRLASIARASARQSRDEQDTFIYLDALGSALKAEPLNRTADSCRRRFMMPQREP